MITEKEVTKIISDEFPELKPDLHTSACNTIYKTMQRFVSFTEYVARTGNISKVKNCFRVAERMLEEGNTTVKTAIENTFVYSIGTFVFSAESTFLLSPGSSIHLKELFSGSLRKEFYRQVCTSGI